VGELRIVVVVPSVVLPNCSVTVPVGREPNPFAAMYNVIMSFVTEVVEASVGTSESCVSPFTTVKVTGALVLAL
jgi:hypothetical protein